MTTLVTTQIKTDVLGLLLEACTKMNDTQGSGSPSRGRYVADLIILALLDLGVGAEAIRTTLHSPRWRNLVVNSHIACFVALSACQAVVSIDCDHSIPSVTAELLVDTCLSAILHWGVSPKHVENLLVEYAD